MFQLTTEEDRFLKSQIATSSWDGKRKLPYAFTEQGIYMLATVLRGELAEQQSIFIMRAFREVHHYIKQNQQFVTQSEMRLVTAKVSEISVQVAGVVEWKNKAEKRFDSIQRSIDILNENFVSDKCRILVLILSVWKMVAIVLRMEIFIVIKKRKARRPSFRSQASQVSVT